MNNVNNPIIVLGPPRSGTSFLGRVLSAHPDLCYLIEPNPVWRRHWRSNSDMIRVDDKSPIVEKTRREFADILNKSGRLRLLEKTPQNCLRLPFVLSVFPDAKVISILRDGVESTLSIAKFWETHTTGLHGVRLSQRFREMSLRQVPYYGVQLAKRLVPKLSGGPVLWGPLLPGIHDMAKELSKLEIAALQWRYCAEQACFWGRKMPRSQYFELRLEDLDRTKLLEILEFTSLGPDEAVLNRFDEQFSSSRVRHRVDCASNEELELVNQWIGPTQRWLGL